MYLNSGNRVGRLDDKTYMYRMDDGGSKIEQENESMWVFVDEVVRNYAGKVLNHITKNMK